MAYIISGLSCLKGLHVCMYALLCVGPQLDVLTVDKGVEYSRVSRASLNKIVDVWQNAARLVSTFFFERIVDDDGYSYVLDTGTTIYKIEVESIGVSDEMTLKITRYQ